MLLKYFVICGSVDSTKYTYVTSWYLQRSKANRMNSIHGNETMARDCCDDI
jgi:hypothetical protein